MNEDKDNVVACQYEWPEQVRTKLRIASVYTGMSMTDLSAMAIDILCDVVETMRSEGRGYIRMDDLMKEMRGILSSHPDLKIVQETLSSFFSI